jgi:HD-GYP domain-containing protein (c-di-GMP phosphodiesterase class II)/pSer/pThr/pTyr-binding forkhead associated (FHA) protein
MPFIRIRTGPNKGKVFEIRDNVITIGRDENQTIQVLDQGVSRAHAEIFRLGDMCFVRDLNSTNGTYVNNVKITEEALKHSDELLIGTTILAYEDKGATPATDVDLESAGPEGEAKIETTTVEIKVDKTRKGEAALGREITSRNLSVIHDVSKLLSSGKDMNASLRSAIERVSEAIGADHGYLFVLDRATGRLVQRAAVEAGDVNAEKVSRTIVKRVMATGMPLLTTDATLDDRFMLSESVVLKKIKSVVASPIMIGDKAEGLLYLHASKLNSTLKVEDLELTSAAGLQIAMALASSQLGERIRGSMYSTIKALVTAMEFVEPKSQGHAERVAQYSIAVGQQMNLGADDLHRLRLGALLHDVGKLAAHQSSSGVLSNEGREIHITAGEKIMQGIEGFEDIVIGIRYHHERADGSGFPGKLKNADTPPLARVIIVTNHFDNLCTTGGPQGHGLAPKDAIQQMAQEAGKLFDEDVVKALVVCHRSGSLYEGVKGVML